jgi:hypothetical protein
MSLIRADLAPYSGDGLLVFDTAARLEWLSLGLTLNHSCMDAQAMRFVTLDGFRFATMKEVGALFTNAGVTRLGGPGGSAPPGNAVGVDMLLRLLGGTTFTPPVERSRGLVPEGPFTAPTPVVAWDLHLNRTDPANAYADSGAGSWNASTREPSTGVYLVRPRP